MGLWEKNMPRFIGLLVGRLGAIMFLIPILYLRLGIESLRYLSQISQNIWANIYEIGTVIHLQDFWWKWTVMLCKQTLHCCLPILYNNLQGKKNINFDIFFSACFDIASVEGSRSENYESLKYSPDLTICSPKYQLIIIMIDLAWECWLYFFFIGTQSCNQAYFYQPWSKSNWGSHYFWIINSIVKIDK